MIKTEFSLKWIITSLGPSVFYYDAVLMTKLKQTFNISWPWENNSSVLRFSIIFSLKCRTLRSIASVPLQLVCLSSLPHYNQPVYSGNSVKTNTWHRLDPSTYHSGGRTGNSTQLYNSLIYQSHFFLSLSLTYRHTHILGVLTNPLTLT